MAGSFREQAVQSLSNPQEMRSRTSLITPRRWLVALAVMALLAAGLMYAAVNSLITPVQGIGWIDRGGFDRVVAPIDGVVTAAPIDTGDEVKKGTVLWSVTGADGVKIDVPVRQDAVLMQYAGSDSSWIVTKGDTIAVLAVANETPELFILLPGATATGFVAGDVVVGADAWATPEAGKAFQCVVARATPYEQPGAIATAYMPSPSIARFVQDNGSVQWAYADCPAQTLSGVLVGDIFPVSVQLERRSLLSFIFGGA